MERNKECLILKIILDEEYRLKDYDIVKIKKRGLSVTRYVRDLEINQSFIGKDIIFQIEDAQRERYCIDDYMGLNSFIVININDLEIEKTRSSDGDYRSLCEIIKIKDNSNDTEIIILTNFED